MATKTKYAKNAGKTKDIALGRLGDSYPAGWCLRFQLSEIYGVPGIGDWDGDDAADAEDYTKAVDRAGHLVRPKSPKDIPLGALVLWTGGRNDHGHAAYSLGGGEIVTTDLPKSGRIGRVPVTDVEAKWGLKLAGYTMTAATGERLTKTSKPAKPKTTAYRVIARSGLRGRAAATTLSRTKVVRPFGYVLQAVQVVTAGGMSWAVTEHGTHYALRYLRPVTG